MQNGKFMWFAAGILLAAGTTSCDDNDPSYDDVTPPHVEVAPSVVSGRITDRAGKPLQQAVVSLDGLTDTTDVHGCYWFDGVKAGTYVLRAKADGKLPAGSKVVVEDHNYSQNVVWSAALSSAYQKEVDYAAEEERHTVRHTEALDGNSKAIVLIEVAVPAGAINAAPGAKVYVMPVYQMQGNSRAGEVQTASDVLIGAQLICSDQRAQVVQPIRLSFQVDPELAAMATPKVLRNNQWEKVSGRVDKDKVVCQVTDFTSCGLFMEVSKQVQSNAQVQVMDELFNNLYGTKNLYVNQPVTYGYQSGIEWTAGKDVLSALLVEKLALELAPTTAELTGSFPLNVRLPVGTMMTVKGNQQVARVSVAAGETSVEVKHYGNVNIKVDTANRKHTGGSN